MRFRVSVFNENTLSEVWHIHISQALFWAVLTAGMLITFVLFAFIIWITPLKNYLPGYNEDIRQNLIVETARIDSLQREMYLQKQYMSMIRDVVSGDVEKDSLQSYDSVAILQREVLQAEYSSATQEFLQQYEEKDHSFLNLFDGQTQTVTYTLFRPVAGVVVRSFSLEDQHYSVEVQAPKKEPVVAVLTGTVVFVNREATGLCNLLLQHDGEYVSVYRHVELPNVRVGAVVRAGEILGVATEDIPLEFEIWLQGSPLDPESIITW